MWVYILTGIPVFLYLLWKVIIAYNSSNNDYWPKRGIKRVLPRELPGAWKFMFGRKAMHEVDNFYYNRYPDAPFVGTMEMRKPVLIIRDPELVKKITVKDFDHFVNRRPFHFGGELSEWFLFNMEGSRWKSLRASMTPTFTSGKMRRMYEHFDKSAKDLANYVEQKGKKGEKANEVVIETRETFGRFTMDVIGSTAFGIDSQCLTDDNSMFYKMGIQLQKIELIRGLKLFFIVVLPKLAKLLNIDFLPKESSSFFITIVKRALAARRDNYNENKKKGGQPSDFLQLMVEGQKAELKDEKDENEQADDLAEFERDAKVTTDSDLNGKAQITDNFVVANSLGFFFAGFDNTEAILTVAAYHLAVNPDIQSKLRDEVDEIAGDYSGKITYDGVGKMNYLDMFISECLRMYPPATRFERKVTKPYTIPATDSTPELTLPIGTMCFFPVLGFHRDPKHYPNPNEFNPEHFSVENKQKRHPYVYMPFGLGPRSCIAMRFVLTEMKAAVAHLVYNFEIRTCNETIIPMKMDEMQGQHRPSQGCKLALVKRR